MTPRTFGEDIFSEVSLAWTRGLGSEIKVLAARSQNLRVDKGRQVDG